MPSNMLEQVLDHIHNYFYTGSSVEGTFTISNHTLDIPGIQNEQYYIIQGSVFNDGIHQYPSDDLTDETFDGKIYPMAVPKSVLDVVDEIAEWVDEYGTVMYSPYQEERVEDVYSYKRATSGRYYGETQSDWQTIFAKRLNAWRKVS